MAVVIDEFEVVANDEDGSQTSDSSAVTSHASGSPTVHELESIVERQCERYERVWAH